MNPIGTKATMLPMKSVMNSRQPPYQSPKTDHPPRRTLSGHDL
jgi:hypothetical protein